MPSEAFLAATSAPPKVSSANSALLKDAGIFLHSFQPQPALRNTFKKSAISPNCLAVSSTHVFAAQAEKAVVQVYNREKGNQEALWPYKERVLSIALALDNTVLVAGTESGSLIVSEILSGRSVTTPASHLQGVDVLAVDTKGRYALSGSGDATVLVWSLLDLLAFPASSHPAQGSRDARHALTGHNAAITALVLGDSAIPTNIAVSGAKDNTAVIWDYISGSKLKTVLLESSPLCLCLDPAQRALYTGYDDGSIQRVDFYHHTETVSSVRSGTSATTPLQPSPGSRWTYTNVDSSPQDAATRCLSLSYDGTSLLSGHSSGAINTWDVGHGRFKGTLAQYAGAPITNLCFLAPTGLASSHMHSPHRASTVVKPRPQEAFSGANGGTPNSIYGFTTAFSERLGGSTLSHSAVPSRLRRRHQDAALFSEALSRINFDNAFLDASINELTRPTMSETMVNGHGSAKNRKAAFDPSDDFMLVTDAAHDQTDALRERLARLESILEKKDAVIEKVQKERNALALREREMLARRANKVRRQTQRHDDSWEGRQKSHGQGNRQRRGGGAEASLATLHANGGNKSSSHEIDIDMESVISTTSPESSDTENDDRATSACRQDRVEGGGESQDDYSSLASNSDLEGVVDTRELRMIDDEAQA